MIVSIYYSTYITRTVLILQAAPLAPPALDICGDELALQVVMGGRDARAPVAMPAIGIPQQGEAPACGALRDAQSGDGIGTLHTDGVARQCVA